MKILSAFPSDYLKAPDLQGREITVVMDRVEIETVGMKKDHLPVLYFQGKDRGLVLNKTNAKKIVEVFGDDTDNWRGEQIILYEAMVEYEGKTGPAIRVRLAPRRNNVPPLTKQAPPSPDSFPEDDIPF